MNKVTVYNFHHPKGRVFDHYKTKQQAQDVADTHKRIMNIQ